MSTFNLSGQVKLWSLGKNSRKYMDVSVPFGVARQIFKTDIFDSKTGKGEQRQVIEPHSRKIERAMEQGDYTPASFGASITDAHLPLLQIEGDTATLAVDSSCPLKNINGGNRFQALNNIRRKAIESKNDEVVKSVDGLPIDFKVYLDGDPQQDFINLQLGKAVDSNHIVTMKAAKKQLSVEQSQAYEVAKLLNTRFPFAGHIKLGATGLASLKFKSLAETSSGSMATSLVGLVRACPQDIDFSNVPEFLAKQVESVTNTLRSNCSDIVREGYPVCPPPDGSVGSSTLLIGVVSLAVYRLRVKGERKLDEGERKRLVDCVREVFNEPANGNLSAPAKRQLMKAFTIDYLGDLSVNSRDGIPTELLELWGASAFGMRATKTSSEV